MEQPEGVAAALTTLLSQFQTHPQTLLEPGPQTVGLLARTPKRAQQGGGYKARAETMNQQRPFSFSSASCPIRVTDPINLVKADPSHSKEQTARPSGNFSTTTSTCFTRRRPFRHQPHPTVCHLRSQIEVQKKKVKANSRGHSASDTLSSSSLPS